MIGRLTWALAFASVVFLIFTAKPHRTFVCIPGAENVATPCTELK